MPAGGTGYRHGNFKGKELRYWVDFSSKMIEIAFVKKCRH
jgi:hypothetical protein